MFDKFENLTENCIQYVQPDEFNEMVLSLGGSSRYSGEGLHPDMTKEERLEVIRKAMNPQPHTIHQIYYCNRLGAQITIMRGRYETGRKTS